ncbi:Carbohydrate-binding protein [Phytophthora palmivora]|uniref:Carbohydrate-binding protein n=1 Tax=Phytophthora palmivora TaxID=4796 RepID=A0A2P4YU91_9STRA|nr:Carbohydrate-binding protein [Phytophthora palmivora]
MVEETAFSEEQERVVGNVVGAPNILAATAVRASNMLNDVSAAGVVSVLPMTSFSGVFRGSRVLVFRDKHKAAQNVEVAHPLWISWRRRDLGLSSDFVLDCVSVDGGLWQVDGELRSSDMSWLKTAEVVLAPCTAKIADRDGVHERGACGLDSVVLQESHVVRSIPDDRSLVSSAAMLQSLVLESTESEPVLLSLGQANVLSKSRPNSSARGAV